MSLFRKFLKSKGKDPDKLAKETFTKKDKGRLKDAHSEFNKYIDQMPPEEFFKKNDKGTLNPKR